MQMDPRQVAEHEGRHAVMAHLMGFDVAEVVLFPQGDSGHCAYTGPDHRTATELELYQLLLVTVAGQAGNPSGVYAQCDIEEHGTRYYAELSRRFGPLKPYVCLLPELLDAARWHLLAEGQRVRRVATALLHERTLSAARVAQLFGVRLQAPVVGVRPQAQGIVRAPRRQPATATVCACGRDIREQWTPPGVCGWCVTKQVMG
jgi:hypothetical protein